MGGSILDAAFEAELFFTRYLVLWSRAVQRAVYDIEEQKQIYVTCGLPSPVVMQRMSLSHDSKRL